MTDYSSKKLHRYIISASTGSVSQCIPGGTPTSSTTSNPLRVIVNLSDSRAGSDLPRWRDIIRNGGNATTNFSGTAFSDDFDSYTTATCDVQTINPSTRKTGYYHYKFDGGINSNTPPSILAVPSSISADVRNRCIRKFLDSIDSAQSSFEAGQDLGEYKETVRSIQHPLGPLKDKILSYLSSLEKVKRSRRKPESLAKTLADTYLEYHFGWQPLVNDVASAIADCGRFRFPTIPIRASAKATFSSVDSVDSNTFLGVQFLRKVRTTSTYQVRYKGAVRVKNLLPDGRLPILQSLQLTPDKWLPTAWDLLPYSWMADYFINIGEVIRGFSALSSDIAWGCVTTRNRTTSQFAEWVPSWPSFSPFVVQSMVHSCFGGSGSLWASSVNRSPFTSADLIPSLQFRLPTSKYAFANMGAILIQRSRRLVPFF